MLIQDSFWVNDEEYTVHSCDENETLLSFLRGNGVTDVKQMCEVEFKNTFLERFHIFVAKFKHICKLLKCMFFRTPVRRGWMWCMLIN